MHRHPPGVRSAWRANPGADHRGLSRLDADTFGARLYVRFTFVAYEQIVVIIRCKFMSGNSKISNITNSNILTLNLSGDYYKGYAQFTVKIDGVQVGGIYTVTASRDAQLTNDLTLTGTWGSGPHKVTVTFTNDTNGPDGDRNLYVNYATYDGALVAVRDALLSTGDQAGFTVAPPTKPLGPGLQYVGLNLAGAEFGNSLGPAYATNPNTGTYGRDYTFPTHAEIDAYSSQGMNIFRVPLQWERLQPAAKGPLDGAYLSRMDDLVRYAGSKGTTVVLDIHNYGYGYGHLVGSAATPDSAFADLWSRIAGHYAATPNVMFDLMNEPNAQAPGQWLTAANAAIAAIRAAGAKQEILVPGTYYENGDSWVKQGNASLFAEKVVDPDNNIAFQIHQYNDWDQNGDWTDVVSPTIGVERLVDVTAWAESRGVRLFLGEFGAGTDTASLSAMKNQLAFVQAHSAVWQGVTAWGGGPWWPEGYPFSTEPVNGAASPQVQVLQQFAPPTKPQSTPTVKVAPTSVTKTLSLRLSEDAWKGHAQYAIEVDGVRIGGVRTASASHEAGQTETVALTGDWGSERHTVAIRFLNDAYSPGVGDRNLYVHDISLDGEVLPDSGAILYRNSSKDVKFGGDTLTLQTAEDVWGEHAGFTAAVDEVQPGGVNTVAASRAAERLQEFAFTGD